MSTQQSSSTISIFRHPSEFPPVVWAALQHEPRSSNIIYAHAAKVVQASRAAAPIRTASADLWIVCWVPGPSLTVQFILSCTSGPLGAYPVFIYTPLSSDILAASFIQSCMKSIIDILRINVPPERVFSVFALDPVADAFATLWTSTVGSRLAPSPVYYHAKFMCCDKTTFKVGELGGTSSALGISRPATVADLFDVAGLCHGFAAASEPFVLSEEAALDEATMLIRDGNVWVHTVQGPNGTPVVTCIVAATRNTDTVAAITKVYTDPNWRSRGYAERLVRYVCHILLRQKESVVLYVAHNNPAARKVYERVGFLGFGGLAGGAGAADSWKELGFDRGMVQLGHW
ncbi:hypothetical protein C8Q77DRAFT_1152625 [Trametes polyzona]|nr:hypothetical protein C8Q77DRAFT_1152625 [Trametes polyzona]